MDVKVVILIIIFLPFHLPFNCYTC